MTMLRKIRHRIRERRYDPPLRFTVAPLTPAQHAELAASGEYVPLHRFTDADLAGLRVAFVRRFVDVLYRVPGYIGEAARNAYRGTGRVGAREAIREGLRRAKLEQR